MIRETVFVEDREFLIERPPDTDIAHPDDAEYIPYWADLWPAARMLAKVMLHEPWTPGTPALELGCGLGLPGIVGLSCGLRVTFSDYDPSALEFAARNARRNGFTDFDVLRLDWREPPADRSYSVLLGSDLIYEVSYVEPLVGVIQKLLAPGGVCLITDQERVPARALPDALTAAGLTFTTRLVRAGEPGGRREKGKLYRIAHR